MKKIFWIAAAVAGLGGVAGCGGVSKVPAPAGAPHPMCSWGDHNSCAYKGYTSTPSVPNLGVKISVAKGQTQADYCLLDTQNGKKQCGVLNLGPITDGNTVQATVHAPSDNWDPKTEVLGTMLLTFTWGSEPQLNSIAVTSINLSPGQPGQEFLLYRARDFSMTFACTPSSSC